MFRIFFDEKYKNDAKMMQEYVLIIKKTGLWMTGTKFIHEPYGFCIQCEGK